MDELFLKLGLNRVCSPTGGKVIPQTATKLDNTPKLYNEFETLLDVHFLHLDSTSMRQIRTQCNNNVSQMKKIILDIIQTRGKMHNPVTHSGGVLLGVVDQVGKKRSDVQKGDFVIPFASMSCLPLHVSEIVDINEDVVEVKGKAIINHSCLLVKIPKDFDKEVALSAIDISAVVVQIERNVQKIKKEDFTAVILGCGKSGITSICTLKKEAPKCRILAIDINEKFLNIAKGFLREGDVVEKADAQNITQVLQFVRKHTNSMGAELVLNCTNVQNVEASAVLSACKRGIVIFFSMATQFDKAALAAESVGLDVELVIGAGVSTSEVTDKMFELLRQDKKLLKYFENLSKVR